MSLPEHPTPGSPLAAALDNTRWHLFDVAWSIRHGIAEPGELTDLANRLHTLADYMTGAPRP